MRVRKATSDPGVKRLAEINTEFVSLVRAGANRQTRFLVRKIAKAVPAADAAPEVKRAAQAARSRQYGIEARDDGNLSYPSDAPTTERLYGDPVNLAYPLGGPGNQPDAARIRNALARFAQARDAYKQDVSKAKVLERIVRAAMAADVAVTAPANDTIYGMLPADLRARLDTNKNAAPGESPGSPADGIAASAGTSDPPAWLTAAGERVRRQLLAMRLQPPVPARDRAPAGPGAASTNAPVGPRSPAPSAPDGDLASLAKENRALRAELHAARAAAARLRSTVGAASAIAPGDAPPTVTKRTAPLWPPDLAQEVARQSKGERQ